MRCHGGQPLSCSSTSVPAPFTRSSPSLPPKSFPADQNSQERYSVLFCKTEIPVHKFQDRCASCRQGCWQGLVPRLLAWPSLLLYLVAFQHAMAILTLLVYSRAGDLCNDVGCTGGENRCAYRRRNVGARSGRCAASSVLPGATEGHGFCGERDVRPNGPHSVSPLLLSITLTSTTSVLRYNFSLIILYCYFLIAII